MFSGGRQLVDQPALPLGRLDRIRGFLKTSNLLDSYELGGLTELRKFVSNYGRSSGLCKDQHLLPIASLNFLSDSLLG